MANGKCVLMKVRTVGVQLYEDYTGDFNKACSPSALKRLIVHFKPKLLLQT